MKDVSNNRLATKQEETQELETKLSTNLKLTLNLGTRTHEKTQGDRSKTDKLKSEGETQS